MNLLALKREWFSNVRGDLVSGTLVALALIPESIAFSIVAGVDPKVGLYASFCIAVLTAIFGGRPGMISAATGAMSMLMIPLVKEHGLSYLFAATILTGMLQVAFGLGGLTRYMKFVPRSVLSGFLNALAIVIFLAQLPQFVGATWQMYALVAGSLAIIYLLPRYTRAVPSALVAIIVMTLISIACGLTVRTVGDMGALPTALPFFSVPQVPWNLETLRILLPYALPLAMVGLMESLLTARIVDEITDTPSDKQREATGQGLANIATGFFGGMAGCAMIGQSMINMKSGGRGRLSTFAAGAFLLLFILVLSDWVVRIPLGALVGVMFMVCVSTFDWHSIRNIRKAPLNETIVMLATVSVVMLTRDLAEGVLVGVLLSAVFFVRNVARLVRTESTLDGDRRIYRVSGELFFASVTDFVEAFDFREPVKQVEIDLADAHLWDGCAVAAIDKVVLGFRRKGIHARLIGLNRASTTLLERLADHQRNDAAQPMQPDRQAKLRGSDSPAATSRAA